jgi:hypothetical protein
MTPQEVEAGSKRNREPNNKRWRMLTAEEKKAAYQWKTELRHVRRS